MRLDGRVAQRSRVQLGETAEGGDGGQQRPLLRLHHRHRLGYARARSCSTAVQDLDLDLELSKKIQLDLQLLTPAVILSCVDDGC